MLGGALCVSMDLLWELGELRGRGRGRRADACGASTFLLLSGSFPGSTGFRLCNCSNLAFLASSLPHSQPIDMRPFAGPATPVLLDATCFLLSLDPSPHGSPAISSSVLRADSPEPDLALPSLQS